MVILGIVLLIGGAVVALLGRHRDVFVIGALIAIAGLIVLLWRLLPETHGTATLALLPLLHFGRRQSGWTGFGPPLPTRQIDPDFARVLAAQVAIGTARETGAGGTPAEGIRARASLAVIGLMLARACPKDEVVQATLARRLETETDAVSVTMRIAVDAGPAVSALNAADAKATRVVKYGTAGPSGRPLEG